MNSSNRKVVIGALQGSLLLSSLVAMLPRDVGGR